MRERERGGGGGRKRETGTKIKKAEGVGGERKSLNSSIYHTIV